jgi:transposase
MDQVHVVRHKVLVEGRSQRAVARELGIARVTVRKYLEQTRRALPSAAERHSIPSTGRPRTIRLEVWYSSRLVERDERRARR